MKKVYFLVVLLLCFLFLNMASCGKDNHTHVFDEWKQISESSCTKQGEMIRSCTEKDCDYTETKYIDLKSHDYEDRITSPTKTKDGYTTHTCKNCSHSFVDTYTPAIGSANLEYDHIVTDESVTCVITGIGTCKDTDIYIPTYIGKYPVVAIAEGAFESCTTIKSVVIPKGIIKIGRSAFDSCSNLEKITISDTVQKIETNAFFMCFKLKRVDISDLTAWCKIDFGSSDANPVYHTEKLFLNDQLVTSLTLTEGITEIGDYAFINCTSISKIIIPEGVTYIGVETFSNCDITSITIPDSVERIQVAAFGGCVKLTNVKLPSGLTEIEMGVFAGCWSLKRIEIPQTVTHIHVSAFEGCSGLVSISIPKSVKMIGAHAFKDCTDLETIVFENTNNWQAYSYSSIGRPIDVTDPEKNVITFTKADGSTHWERQ